MPRRTEKGGLQTSAEEWKSIHPDLPPGEPVPDQGETFDIPGLAEWKLTEGELDMLHSRLDGLVLEFQRLNLNLQGIKALEEALKVPEDEKRKVQRRRTEDEMRGALRLILSGASRPRDDESPQILDDAINEIFALRKLNMDLMQTIITAYQNGLAAIRDLTSR